MIIFVGTNNYFGKIAKNKMANNYCAIMRLIIICSNSHKFFPFHHTGYALLYLYTNSLYLYVCFSSKSSPTVPVILIKTILNGHNRVVFNETFVQFFQLRSCICVCVWEHCTNKANFRSITVHLSATCWGRCQGS